MVQFFFWSSPRLSTWSNLVNRRTITVFIFCIPLLTVWCFLWLLVNCCGRKAQTLTDVSKDSISQFKSCSKCDEMLRYRQVSVSVSPSVNFPRFCPFLIFDFILHINNLTQECNKESPERAHSSSYLTSFHTLHWHLTLYWTICPHTLTIFIAIIIFKP